MKKFWFEILLVVIGIVLLCSTDSTQKDTDILHLIGLGFVVMAIIWSFVHYRMIKDTISIHANHPAMQNAYTQQEKRTENNTNDYRSPPQSFTASKKDEERMGILDQQLPTLRNAANNEIICYDDIAYLSTINLTSKDIDYLAGKLTCPLFSSSITVKSIKESIDNMDFSEDQVITLFKQGSQNLRERLISSCKNNSWNIPSRLFDYLMESDRMLLLTMVLSQELFLKLINTLSSYELLGYRVTECTPDEDTHGTVENLLTGKDIPYYEDVDTDVVYIAEQNFPNDDKVRKLAFDKVFAGPCDLIETIGRLDTLTEYEVKKIFERGNEKEIEKMLDRNDSDDVVDYLPPKHAVSVVLGIIPSDYSDYIHNKFDFTSIDHKVWLEIFQEFSPDELTGHRMKKIEEDEEPEGQLSADGQKDIPYYSTGDHDIITLIEEHINDDNELRKLAFDRVLGARYLVDIIQNLDTITEYETQKIMERNDTDEVEALLGRNDSNDIITNLSEEVAIKIILGIMYAGSADEVKDHYSFNNSGAFMRVIEELSAYELLGFRMKPERPNEETDYEIPDLKNPGQKIPAYGDANYDIIKLIEDEMSGDGHLRQLAFDKICQGNNMDEAIERWENITADEVTKIIERGFSEEFDALAERSDFDDDIRGNLPDAFIIRQRLLENNSSMDDEYVDRIDTSSFKNKVEIIISSLSSKVLSDKEDYDDVTELDNDIVIKIHLRLIDTEDYTCSFDNDDVSGEFSDRMTNDEKFKNKVENLAKRI